MIPVLPVLSSFGPKITLKEPSEKRAAKVLPAVVQSAVAGNLLAIAVLDARTTYGIAKERAVWQGGYNQVAASRPDLIAAYQQRKGSLKVPSFAGPEDAAQWATANVITVSTAVQGSSAAGTATAPVPAPPSGAPTAGGTSKWVILALIAGGGALLYFAFRGAR